MPALPETVGAVVTTTLREKLVKIGAKGVRHGRYVTFQLAEMPMACGLFAEILNWIDWLRGSPWNRADPAQPYPSGALPKGELCAEH